MLVPSHFGLTGKSAADNAAKAALFLPVSNLTVPHSYIKSVIRIQGRKQWQLLWISETVNKLHLVEPRVNVINMFRVTRRDEVKVKIRLRIGHTYLTHGLLLRRETPLLLGLSSRLDC